MLAIACTSDQAHRTPEKLVPEPQAQPEALFPETPSLRQKLWTWSPRTIRIRPVHREHSLQTAYKVYGLYHQFRPEERNGRQTASHQPQNDSRAAEMAAGAAGGTVLLGCAVTLPTVPVWAIACPLSLMAAPFAALGGAAVGAATDKSGNPQYDSSGPAETQPRLQNLYLVQIPTSRIFNVDTPAGAENSPPQPSHEIARRLSKLLRDRTPHHAYMEDRADGAASSLSYRYDDSLNIDVTRFGFVSSPYFEEDRRHTNIAPLIRLFIEVRIPYYHFSGDRDLLIDYQYVQYLGPTHTASNMPAVREFVHRYELSHAYTRIADHILGEDNRTPSIRDVANDSSEPPVYPLTDARHSARCDEIHFTSRAIFRIHPGYSTAQTCTGMSYESFDERGVWKESLSIAQLRQMLAGNDCTAQIMGTEIGRAIPCTKVFVWFESYFESAMSRTLLPHTVMKPLDRGDIDSREARDAPLTLKERCRRSMQSYGFGLRNVNCRALLRE